MRRLDRSGRPTREVLHPKEEAEGEARRGRRGVGCFWAALYGLLLTGFTLYLALDTFAISRVAIPVPEQGQASSQTQQEDRDPARAADAVPESRTPTVAADGYDDGNIRITLTEYREHETDIYVADVVLSSAESLRTAFAQNAYGRNLTETTSEVAARVGAVLAINGDYYGARERGYVIRNGVLYRTEKAQDQEDLVIYADGSFGVITEGDVDAQALLEDGARQVLSFGPALVIDGEIAVHPEMEVGRAKASNPRTAIAVVDELHYLFVVSDGRTNESEGLSLREMAQFLQELEAVIAYNLDGGGSSTLYFNGRVVNNPTTNGRSIQERRVSDIVYFGG